MSETSKHLPIENPPTPEGAISSPTAEANKTRVAAPLPASPLERAKLESEGKIRTKNELEDRSTMVAFGLLFVVPIVVILFAMLLLLPFINSQLTQDPDPGGAAVQTGPSLPPPTR